VKTLEEYVKGKSFRELEELYRAIREGRISVEDPNPPRDFLDYLTRPDYSLWLWTSLGIALLTLASIWLSDAAAIFAVLRYILGSVFVLFLPGYATVEALYPGERDLSNLERLALSIGLSLAVVPLIGLLLNYTPWGIRLAPVAAAITVYTTALLFVAALRKYNALQRRAPRLGSATIRMGAPRFANR